MTIARTVDRSNLGRLTPAQHAAVLSAPWTGRYVTVYGSNRDGWHEWRPTSDLGTAERDVRWLNGGAR